MYIFLDNIQLHTTNIIYTQHSFNWH